MLLVTWRALSISPYPAARMRLALGAKHLLDGAWQLLAPVRHEFQLTLTGAGEKVGAVQVDPGLSALGLSACSYEHDACRQTLRSWSHWG